jgi:hypothetical protein
MALAPCVEEGGTPPGGREQKSLLRRVVRPRGAGAKVSSLAVGKGLRTKVKNI